MSIFALQSAAGGFLDEGLKRFNKEFDDWCIQFDNYEDANVIRQNLGKRMRPEIVEITPLSYPKYFFYTLKGVIHATRQIDDKIICIVEPYMSSNFRIAVCDLNTKQVSITKTSYKNILSVEGAFAHYEV
ncbi:MAG: hypothetical protein U9Q40_07885 [Campylobacterota bacterium]|nr:hypothetical protein [Campylobacterota bacterium]